MDSSFYELNKQGWKTTNKAGKLAESRKCKRNQKKSLVSSSERDSSVALSLLHFALHYLVKIHTSTIFIIKIYIN